MTLKILFFAQYRELVQHDEVELSVPVGSSVSEALLLLRGLGEGFSALPVTLAVARNQVVVAHSELLSDGDELALLPPVAGG